jgi:hypothetical protein
MTRSFAALLGAVAIILALASVVAGERRAALADMASSSLSDSRLAAVFNGPMF